MLKYQFPDKFVPYSSTILLELHHITEEDYYYVNVSINGEELMLPANCQQSRKCQYENFVELAKAKSFYSDYDGYVALCGLLPEATATNQREKWIDTTPIKLI